MTSPSRRVLGFALAVFSLVAVGCVKGELHRPQNIEVQDQYSLAFIEFDDQGEPWAPSQLERTLDLIETAQTRGRVGVLLFVHGWHNDASKREDRKRDNNVEGFQRLLEVIHDQLQAEGAFGPDDTIIGVYIGWRGRSSDSKWIKPLTFYSRRGAGQRVAGVGTTEAIVRVMTAARKPGSTGVVIGHSFGGMIVERALMQTLVAVAASEEGEVDPLADLVILINPASQSMEAKAMLSILERNRLKYYRTDEDGTRRETPFIVSVTSTTDSATGSLYPMALGLKGNTKNFRQYGATDCSPLPSQKDFYKKTAGHNRVLHSHRVIAQPLTQEQLDQPASVFALEESINAQTGARDFSFPGEEHRFTIERLPLSFNDSPYWIMSVPPELIDGHSDIFTFDTMQLLRGLLMLSGAGGGRHHQGYLERETGVRPLHLDVLAGGEMLFIERSRRFFVLGKNRKKPLALACWPSIIDPQSAIGGHVDGSRVTLFSSGIEEGNEDKMRTDVITFDFASVGSDSVEWTQFKSDVLFTAAAGEDGHDEAYLFGDGALWVADLTKKKPQPVRLFDLEEPAAVDQMAYDAVANRLFALDQRTSTLHVIDLENEPIEARLVGRDLGVPVDLFLSDEGIVLIVDAEGRRVLRLDCSEGRDCGPPEVFAAIDAFQQPNSAAMDAEGNVWVGDLGAETIFGFDASGKLVRVLDSLAGVTAPE